MREDMIRRLLIFDFADVEMDVKTTGWTGMPEQSVGRALLFHLRLTLPEP